MTAVARVAAAGKVDLDLLLLETKLAIPLPRDGLVSRRDLIDKARDRADRVVAISAPAGYGKSSLLSQWAADEDRAVAWLTLDRFDCDPAALLTSLAAAFVRATEGDLSLVADMRGNSASALGRAAPRLAGALSSSDRPYVIMLDDLQEVDSPACHDVLGVLIEAIPPESQFVAASRVEQPHVPRLRAQGDAFEIGIAELALDAPGAQHVFARADVELPMEAADLVVRRTEGWPVGVYLASIIARDGEDEVISGDDRYVADYLYRESLARLPEDAQRFLRRTAVLDRLTADLCDAVLDGSGSQRRLRELEASNVLLVPLDRRRAWYRYHPLFREFLLSELRETEPESIPQLHERAASWYEAHGSAALAVEHLLQTQESARCVRLVTEIALPTYQAGQMGTLQRWMEALGGDTITTYPPLAVLAGWTAVMSGHDDDAECWARVIDGADFDLPPADGTASFESSRAMLRAMMYERGAEQAMADARFALTQEPSWSPWHDQATYLVAEAHFTLGEREQAEALFAEASDLAMASGGHDVQVLADSERALIEMDSGRWTDAAAHIARALELIDNHRLDDYSVAVVAFAGAGRLALHRRDTVAAEQQLARAMRARQYCSSSSPSLAVRVRTSLARTHLAMGDPSTARHLVRESEAILAKRPELGALPAELAEVVAMIDASPTGASGAPPLTPAELRLLPYLQTHLTLPEIASRLFISRNTISTEVGSVYRKLGVASRNEAVLRATALGLLGA